MAQAGSDHLLFAFVFGLKLQRECSEQWVSDAWELFLMFLCDIASLIRLSITIQLRARWSRLETTVGRALKSTCEAGL
jgi:hypothetical protein